MTKTIQKDDQSQTEPYIDINEKLFTKNYVDFLNEAGWTLEKKLPSNESSYSDLLEDTEWNETTKNHLKTKHYRRDLDAIS